MSRAGWTALITGVNRSRYGEWIQRGQAATGTRRPTARLAADAATPGVVPKGQGEDADAGLTTEQRLNSVWRFNAEHRYMPALYWGPTGYRPVTYLEYMAFKLNKNLGRPYYGRGKMYGTNGSWTRTHYRSSTYMTTIFVSRRYGGYRYGRSGYRGSSYGGYGK